MKRILLFFLLLASGLRQLMAMDLKSALLSLNPEGTSGFLPAALTCTLGNGTTFDLFFTSNTRNNEEADCFNGYIIKKAYLGPIGALNDPHTKRIIKELPRHGFFVTNMSFKSRENVSLARGLIVGRAIPYSDEKVCWACRLFADSCLNSTSCGEQINQNLPDTTKNDLAHQPVASFTVKQGPATLYTGTCPDGVK